MALPVSLRQIVTEVEALQDGWTIYLNRKTGELMTITDREARIALEEEQASELADWLMEDFLPKVKEVVTSDDSVALPNKASVEFALMEKYCAAVDDPQFRESLLNAVRGQEAAARFNDLIEAKSAQDEWNQFKEEALRDLIAEFLDSHGIGYVESKSSA
ncbi:UPF0158 family protein [Nitrococcus mobilis]|uniref:Uncharacterized protein n=1 Tax=Nitrococcus mobilis Nb-231 TaxID=314278 RepID=A4BTG9_9GAMM|nr:UPF0158 family protein [Nitrococcus mobilis]EAR20925.1 hypothetical protein NB231_00030 [Nitrococcus mobilis Nb-231]